MPRELFVVMPFGRRAHPGASPDSVVDFDSVYADVIKPAAVNAGWSVSRGDESSAVGEISQAFIEQLFRADLVVADVSVANGNVYYELGVRHGISTGGTILIAIEGSELPFDIRNQRAIFYRLDGNGPETARGKIAAALEDYQRRPGRNPVRQYLESVGASSNPAVDPGQFAAELNGRIERASSPEQVHAVWNWAKHLSPQPLSGLLRLSRRFGELGDWASGVEVLQAAVRQHDNDYEAHRQLGWCLRKANPDSYDEAEAEFNKALAINPDDPEALGMLGGMYKRMQRYADAKRCYDRAAALAPSSEYALVNQAAMTVLASPQAPKPGIELYRGLLARFPERATVSDIWSVLIAAEAAFAAGDDDAASAWFTRAQQLASSAVPLESAIDQLDLFAGVGFRADQALEHRARLQGAVERMRARAVAVVSFAPEEPASAPARPSLPVLIHLSDLHFGTRPGPGGPQPMHRFVEGEYTEPLVRHLEREFAGRPRVFEFDRSHLHLIVSRDLAYTADENEFAATRDFLQELTRILDIPRERVHLVPGNHDVHWPSTNVHLSHRFDNYIGLLYEFYGQDLLRKRYPYLKWDLRFNSERDLPGNLLSLYSSDQLVIVGFNSCVYETPQDHFGFVGGKQTRLLDDWLFKIGAIDGAARVAIIHHHLHPYPESLTEQRGPQEIWQDLSTIRDAGLVERALEQRGFDLVLHGHKHQAQLRETLMRQQYEQHRIVSRLIVCGCGSTGVARSELEQGDGNHYQVLELLQAPRKAGVPFVKIHWRELAYRADAQWRTTEAWTLDG